MFTSAISSQNTMQLLDYTNELVILLNSNGEIFEVNKTALDLLGYSKDEILTQTITTFISGNDHSKIADTILSASNNIILDDVVLKNKDGNEFYVTIRVFQNSPQVGEIALFINADIQAKYEELIAETNNRARYIFGLMNAVLAADEKFCKDDYHKNLFHEIKNNLLNISGVHEIILDEKDFSQINLEKKILRIFGYMQNLYPQMQNVEIEIKVNKVFLHISQAMTLGLIINQLIQISYEQSFKISKAGKISLTLHISGSNCVLSYRDNGTELNENQINGHLLELKLAEFFSNDVKGKFNIATGNGNKFSLSFPIAETKPASKISID